MLTAFFVLSILAQSFVAFAVPTPQLWFGSDEFEQTYDFTKPLKLKKRKLLESDAQAEARWASYNEVIDAARKKLNAYECPAYIEPQDMKDHTTLKIVKRAGEWKHYNVTRRGEYSANVTALSLEESPLTPHKVRRIEIMVTRFSDRTFPLFRIKGEPKDLVATVKGDELELTVINRVRENFLKQLVENDLHLNQVHWEIHVFDGDYSAIFTMPRILLPPFLRLTRWEKFRHSCEVKLSVFRD